MYTRLLTTLAASVLFFTGVVAVAEEAPIVPTPPEAVPQESEWVPCAEHEALVDWLVEAQGALPEPILQYVQMDGNLVETYGFEDGRVVVLSTDTTGITCILDAGKVLGGESSSDGFAPL